MLCSGQDVAEEGVGRRAVLYGDLRVPVGCRAICQGGDTLSLLCAQHAALVPAPLSSLGIVWEAMGRTSMFSC